MVDGVHNLTDTAPYSVVTLDPTYSAELEWAAISQHCSPGAVLINNVNLPGHAGWIRDEILVRDKSNPREIPWHEVYSGSWTDPDMNPEVSPFAAMGEAVGMNDTDIDLVPKTQRMLYGRRQFVILMREDVLDFLWKETSTSDFVGEGTTVPVQTGSEGKSLYEL